MDWSSAVCSSDLLYLVDGSGYIFRAYFAIPPRNTSDGTPTNATFGFTNMLVKLLRESDADAIAVIFDASAKTFRNDIYPQYKAHRPEPPEDLVPPFAEIGRASCRGKSVSVRVDLGGPRIIKKKNKPT